MSVALFNELLFGITFLILVITMIIMSTVAILRYRKEAHHIGENTSRIDGLSRHYDALSLRMDMLVTEWRESAKHEQPPAKEPTPIQLPKTRAAKGVKNMPESE